MQLGECDAKLGTFEQSQVGSVFRIDYVNSDELVKSNVQLNSVEI